MATTEKRIPASATFRGGCWYGMIPYRGKTSLGETLGRALVFAEHRHEIILCPNTKPHVSSRRAGAPEATRRAAGVRVPRLQEEEGPVRVPPEKAA